MNRTNYSNYALGGCLMGITYKAHNLGYESPLEIEWKATGKDLILRKYYYIRRSEYRQTIRRTLAGGR